jgi:hypothetical protein
MECKFWLKPDTFDIVEAFAYAMVPKDQREVRELIFQHFRQIEAEWNAFQRRKNP